MQRVPVCGNVTFSYGVNELSVFSIWRSISRTPLPSSEELSNMGGSSSQFSSSSCLSFSIWAASALGPLLVAFGHHYRERYALLSESCDEVSVKRPDVVPGVDEHEEQREALRS